MRTCQTPRQHRGGFTLIEVLLVLAILGMLMTLVVPKLLGRQKHASVDATRISIQGVEQALRFYSFDHGGLYPTQSDGLAILRKRPDQNDPDWKGPYLERPAEDAWGNPLEYRYPGTAHPDGFDIVSAGLDRVLGTEDDLINDGE